MNHRFFHSKDLPAPHRRDLPSASRLLCQLRDRLGVGVKPRGAAAAKGVPHELVGSRAARGLGLAPKNDGSARKGVDLGIDSHRLPSLTSVIYGHNHYKIKCTLTCIMKNTLRTPPQKVQKGQGGPYFPMFRDGGRSRLFRHLPIRVAQAWQRHQQGTPSSAPSEPPWACPAAFQ